MFSKKILEFLKDKSGHFALTFGVSIIPVMFTAGMAVDYSNISRERSRMQETVDSSAIYAVKELENPGYSENDLQSIAEKVVASNFDIYGDVATHVDLDKVGNFLTVDVTKRYPPAFLQIMRSDPIDMHVLAKVNYGEVIKDLSCILTLKNNGQGTLTFNGNANINAEHCTVHVNSESEGAVDLNGNGWLKAKKNCFHGGVQSGLPRISPSPENRNNCDVLPDPFDEYKTSVSGACDHYDFKTNGNRSITLEPGVYCGGISIGSGGKITFKPGVYNIRNGVFKTTGNVELYGNGVSFFFSGYGVALDFSGTTDYYLIAMGKAGAQLAGKPNLAGFLVFFDQAADKSLTNNFTGTSETYFEGVLYFGERDLEISGVGEVNSGSPYSAIVANTIVLDGNGTINFTVDEDHTELPILEELYSKSVTPRLIK